jgi:hypothetical protein
MTGTEHTGYLVFVLKPRGRALPGGAFPDGKDLLYMRPETAEDEALLRSYFAKVKEALGAVVMDIDGKVEGAG